MGRLFANANEFFVKKIKFKSNENSVLVSFDDPNKSFSKKEIKNLFEKGLIVIEDQNGNIIEPNVYSENKEENYAVIKASDGENEYVFYSNEYEPPVPPPPPPPPPSPYIVDDDVSKEISLPQETFTSLGFSDIDTILHNDSAERGFPIGYEVTLTLKGSKNANAEYYFDQNGSTWSPNNAYEFDSNVTTEEKNMSQTLTLIAGEVAPVGLFMYAYTAVNITVSHIKIKRIELE